MKFFTGIALVLEALSVFAGVLADAEPEVIVDKLVSRRSGLGRRDRGYSNGGSKDTTGKWKNGRQKNGKNYEISFYHINDVHAHLDEFRASGSSCIDPSKGCVGGYSRVKTVIDQTRKTHKNSLFLNAGDEFQGTLFYTIFKGEKIAETLNQLGFDAMTLGNHEFDDGDDLLAGFLHNLTFPVISSNVHTDNRELASALLPYKIFKKHKLAVLAVTTETTAGISNPGNGTTFEDPVAAAIRTVKAIKKKHRDIKRIVALTHIGYDKDIELAKATTDISLIIGGHSHTLLGNQTAAKGKYPTIETNLDGDEVFIVQAYRWGEYLGYIDVEYDSKGKIVAYEGAPFHLTNATKEDVGLKSQIKGWSTAFEAYSGTVLGVTEFDLIQSTCQSMECTLGDFTADSMEDYRPSENLAGAIINAGGIRAEIDAGKITLQQALECFPFGNSIVELDFTGEQLWTIFEGIASRLNQENGLAVTSMVQVSRSIRLTYNPTNPVGSRLITLKIKAQPIDLTKTYTISTLDFLATGGDNFWAPRTDFVTLDTMDEVWADYVREVTPISYVLDGRIATTTETVPQKGV
ncbi:5'-nucleotidase [Tricharina praecox]|uniref:5'-nucleotidase n=1 Tax=Tricharina praecox TaxID=43433 RepID=UPI002220579E|nr:5'-nucleotidase [Tricharina praecox]KAI5859001.1 5'-nucleotidase [Tricharina praecox]